MLISGFEVLLKCRVLWTRLFELVDGDAVRDCLDQASILAGCDDIERAKPKFKSVQVKNVLELRDHLRSKLFLF